MRRGRILIGTLGLDQHEVGAVTVAHLLRDAGFEVLYTGRFNLPPAIVKTAAEESVDVIGLSCHSWEYLHYTDALLAGLAAAGLGIPVVLGGSVITAADRTALLARGVAAVFGPGARAEEIVATMRRLVVAGVSPSP